MKRDIWQETWFLIVVGIITTMVFIHIKPEWAPYVYPPGVIYGVLGYEAWLLLVETWPYDEGHEPNVFDGKQAFIAGLLPVGICLAILIVVLVLVLMLIIAVFWTGFQLMSGRLELADLY